MPNKQKKSNKQNTKAVFIFYFVVTFLLAFFILGIAFKHFSPTVDVNIGQNEIPSDEINSDSEMDDRLKWIQYEDNIEEQPTSEKYLQAESNNLITKETNTKTEKQETIRPKRTVNETKPKNQSEEIPLPVNTKYITVPPVPTINEVRQNTPAPSVKVTKVYIGFYNDINDALAAKAKISETVPGIQPFVKAVNGQYIVQAGSFTDRQKAVELRDNLNNRGYSAKLLSY